MIATELTLAKKFEEIQSQLEQLSSEINSEDLHSASCSVEDLQYSIKQLRELYEKAIEEKE